MSTPTYTSLTLSGTAVSSGSAVFTTLLLTPLALTGTALSSGGVTVTVASTPGAFDDFALVPEYAGADYTDPAITHVTSIVPRNAPSDTVNAWQRVSITASAPTAYAPGPAGQLYNPAAYARLRLYTDAMPVPSVQEITCGQFERTPGDPSDLSTDRPGINLLSLAQSSYEGPMLYVTPDTGATYERTTTASCGQYGGMYSYATPPAANTYTALQAWGTYANAEAQRATYSALTYIPAPGAAPGTGTGLSFFTVQPTPSACVPVQVGTLLNASLAMQLPVAGQFFSCQIQFFDSNYTLLSGDTVTGPASTSVAGAGWQTVAAAGVVPSGVTYAAVVPVASTSADVNSMTFFADEHRLYVPDTHNPAAVGVSPARVWHSPKLITITPAATRVNLATNPAFQNDTTGYGVQAPVGYTPTFVVNPTGGLGGGSCAEWQVTSVAPSAINNTTASPWTGILTSATGTVMASNLQPSTLYTVSVYVRPLAGSPGVTLWAYDGAVLQRGPTTPIVSLGAAAPYTRLSLSITTSASFGGNLVLNLGYAGGDVGHYYSAVQPGTDPTTWLPVAASSYSAWSASDTYAIGAYVNFGGNSYQANVANGPYTLIPSLHFYADEVLIEATGELRAYFDGNSPSSDYMWEGTAGNSRSHYYQGKSVNQYRLSQAVERALPVGAKYRIVYAAPPVSP